MPTATKIIEYFIVTFSIGGKVYEEKVFETTNKDAKKTIKQYYPNAKIILCAPQYRYVD